SRLTLALLCVTPACNVYNANLLGEATAGDSGGTPHTGAADGSGGTANSGGLGGFGPTGGQDAGATGGGTGDGGAGGSTGGSAPADPVYELIDDMEDDDPSVLPAQGRNGRWNTYNDGTVGGV